MTVNFSIPSYPSYLVISLQKKKSLGLIHGLLQLQFSVIPLPCVILLLTFVTYKSHYLYWVTLICTNTKNI